MTDFDAEVYAQIRLGTQRSAETLAPMILHSIPDRPRRPSVLDVGCGEAWWSEAFLDLGCAVDSIDQAAPLEHAPGVHIDEVDLEGEFVLQRGYDLAVCLEVAEHISPAAGGRLVEQLTRSAAIVAWSAAIPGQGGHGHVNEQWPAYWQERFDAHGWSFLDPWRDAVWEDPSVEPWYQQNLLMAVPAPHGFQAVRALVHPLVFDSKRSQADWWREHALRRERAIEAIRVARQDDQIAGRPLPHTTDRAIHAAVAAETH